MPRILRARFAVRDFPHEASCSILVPHHVSGQVLPTKIAPCRSHTGDAMSDHDSGDEKVPLMQQLLDNPFLLLFLGVLIPMIVYTLWGVIDILTIPLAK
jgi:hypothetical protein